MGLSEASYYQLRYIESRTEVHQLRTAIKRAVEAWDANSNFHNAFERLRVIASEE